MDHWQEDEVIHEEPYPEDVPLDDADVSYIDYSQTSFEDADYSDENEELDDMHRFHVAMNVFDLVSVLTGLAVIFILVAILVSFITWLQSDITQSFTLLTSQLQ